MNGRSDNKATTALVMLICAVACACAIFPDSVGVLVTRIVLITLGIGVLVGGLWLADVWPHRPLRPPAHHLDTWLDHDNDDDPAEGGARVGDHR